MRPQRPLRRVGGRLVSLEGRESGAGAVLTATALNSGVPVHDSSALALRALEEAFTADPILRVRVHLRRGCFVGHGNPFGWWLSLQTTL